MLSEWIEEEFSPRNRAETQAALRQVLQQIALAGLFRAGFFEKAAFYGDTALRLFYGLPRFSEDLDFSLLRPQPEFSLAPYLRSLEKECAALGVQMTSRKKGKAGESPIDTAFLRSDTQIRELILQTGEYKPGPKERVSVKVKLEVDTRPPLEFSTEERLLLKPFSCYIKCFAPSDLFAGKLHALLFRSWKNRVKGRDWFDFEWYLKKDIPLNLSHLKARMTQSGHWPKDHPLEREEVIQLLQERIEAVDFGQAKTDVRRFLRDPSVLEIWSAAYFHDLTGYLRWEGAP
jgi:hypothetical protein